MRRFFPLAVLPFALLVAAAACGGEAEEVASPEGDELTSPSNLKGLDLPVGTFALTFDDGPSAVTEGLANWLHDQGIAATFFVNGYHRGDSAYQRRLGAIVKAGHLLANHTENHCYSGATAAPCNSTPYASLSADTQIDEILRVHSDIAALQPQGPFLLRTPGGSWDATTATTLNSRLKVDYLGPIHWSAGDNVQIGGVNYKADYACWSSNTSVATCLTGYQAMLRNAKRGFILMHDLKSQTVEMVKLLVPWMKTAGYKFALPTASPSVQALAGTKGMPNDAKPTCKDCEDPAPRATVGQTCGASGGTACIWSSYGKGATCAKDGASVPCGCLVTGTSTPCTQARPAVASACGSSGRDCLWSKTGSGAICVDYDGKSQTSCACVVRGDAATRCD